MKIKVIKDYISVICLYTIIKVELPNLTEEYPLFCSKIINGLLLSITFLTIFIIFFYYVLLAWNIIKKDNIDPKQELSHFEWKTVLYAIINCVFFEIIHRLICY